MELCFGTPGSTNSNSGSQTLAKRYALAQRDGDIVDLDGSSSLLLPIKADNCRAVVRHKNHLGVMSAQPLGLNAPPLLFDTTATNTPLFTLNAPQTGPARKTVGNTRTLWPGDAWTLTAPHDVQYTGQANDRDVVLSAVGGVVPTNELMGYHRSAINLDGVVKYTSSNNDRDIILQTFGGVVPTTIVYEQVS